MADVERVHSKRRAVGCGPRGALRTLEDDGQSMSEWMQEARLNAIFGSCQLSIKSVKSGIRCYIAFVGGCRHHWQVRSLLLYLCTDKIHRDKVRYFPPELDVLLAWSTLFRSSGTWNNYLGHVRTACMACKVPTKVILVLLTQIENICDQFAVCRKVFDSPALVRARNSIVKAQNFVPRQKLWIKRLGVCTCK